MSHLDIFNVPQNSSAVTIFDKKQFEIIIVPKFEVKYDGGGVYTFFNLYLYFHYY